MIIALIVVYVLGCLLSAGVLGYLDEYPMLPVVIVWPVLAAVMLPIAFLLIPAAIGEWFSGRFG